MTAFWSKTIFMSELRDILTKPYRTDIKEEKQPAEKPDFTGRKILLAEDNALNQEIAVEILQEVGFSVDVADDGEEAVEILKREQGEISLVLLDVIMPEMDGYDVLEQMNRLGIIDDIPVIMISAESSPGFITRAYDLGAADYVSRPFETTVVQRRVKNTITLYAKQRKLMDIVADQVYEKEKNNNLMISILSHIVEFRNGESGAHVIHINIITELLLKQLIKKSSKYDLSMTDIRLISTASSLHDIGKIAIPDEILNKPGRFTPQEYEIMKTHSEIGASMLKNLSEYQNEPLMKASYQICRWHHERYDGRGYPDGLKGDDIPIAAQIVSIADVYDALTSERCYKKAYSHEKAIEMICGGECGAFNPLLIECLTDISGFLEKELQTNTSGIKNKLEIQEVTDELLSNNDLSVSGQMLQQLEFERNRAAFFEDSLSGVTFSFRSDPPVLSLSEKGAEQLGLSREVSAPLDSPEVQKISDGSLEKLLEKISHASASEPDVNMKGHILIDGKLADCEFRCRTMWMSSDDPVYIGTAGTIFFLKMMQTDNKEDISVKEMKKMDFSLLKQIGINTYSAVERFIGNEALYVKMLKKFLDDKTFPKLTEAVSEGNGQAALEASHTLKGICGNLSIEKLFELFSEQVVLMKRIHTFQSFPLFTKLI